jgi:hypothetical protein
MIRLVPPRYGPIIFDDDRKDDIFADGHPIMKLIAVDGKNVRGD